MGYAMLGLAGLLVPDGIYVIVPQIPLEQDTAGHGGPPFAAATATASQSLFLRRQKRASRSD